MFQLIECYSDHNETFYSQSLILLLPNPIIFLFYSINFIKEKMHSLPNQTFPTLNNSIYINKSAEYFKPLCKTEEIMREDPNPPIKINETIVKPMNFNKFEAIIAGTYGSTARKTLENSLETSSIRRIDAHHENYLEKFSDKSKEPQRAHIRRPCHQHLLINPLSEIESCQPKLDERWRQRRDSLAARSRNRKVQALNKMRQQTYEKIYLQNQEDAESVIQQQIDFDQLEMKEHRIRNFLTRQKFFTQEKQIMRQMRQFCLYGAIKIDQKSRIY